MHRLSTVTLAALLAGMALGAAEAQTVPQAASAPAAPRTIVLYGASWCAPCVAEVRDLARLAAAALPDRIVIVWADAGIWRYPIGRHDNARIALPAEARELATPAPSDSAGLPFSVMTADRKRRCAAWNGPLHPADIARLRASCDAALR